MDTDPCARLTCSVGTVCRGGACSVVDCQAGCQAGEVCDGALCRPIQPCRFAVPCGDGGLCEGAPLPDGERCDDGVACTSGDTCVAGACSGAAYSCPPPDQCQQAVACAGDGGCEVTARPDGVPCDDGVSCTFDDQCVGGSCGGTSYVCQPDQCAATSVCAGDGGCAVTPRNVGAACDDTQACTFADACDDAGVCAGNTYACPGVTACKEAGVCLGDGGCAVVDKANGTACDDALSCTTADQCTNGSCSGAAVTSWLDSDGDGKGDLAVTQQRCPLSSGYVLDGGDCNDSSPFVKDVLPAATDSDRDGVTATTTLNAAACVGASSLIQGRTYYRDATGAFSWLDTASPSADCDDGDPDVFSSRPMVVVDADHDGYSTGTTLARCVGASMTFNGRTYYGDASGSFLYLDLSARLGGGDCDDMSAVVLPQTFYRDADGDGRGLSTNAQVQCPQLAGWVTDDTDCNDASALVYRTVAALYDDADQDGYSSAAAASFCVGVTTPIGGRTYYRTAAGTYPYTTTNLGADCDSAAAALFTTRNSVVPDDDRDGYPSNVTATTQCAGATTTVGGRTYYADGAGGHWMPRGDCIETMGSNCDGAFVDCYDQNASASFGQLTYFTVHRGDGSFDYNCSGGPSANVTATFCASTSPGVALYTDGTCATANGTGTVCNTPTAFALPAACGKNTSGAGTFTNPGVCGPATLATATVIGCR